MLPHIVIETRERISMVARKLLQSQQCGVFVYKPTPMFHILRRKQGKEIDGCPKQVSVPADFDCSVIWLTKMLKRIW